MGRKVLFCDRWVIGMFSLVLLFAGQTYADEPSNKKPDEAIPKIPLDCRYGQTYEKTDGETIGEAFPSDDVFRPLLADPKQPQFFATWRATRSLLSPTEGRSTRASAMRRSARSSRPPMQAGRHPEPALMLDELTISTPIN